MFKIRLAFRLLLGLFFGSLTLQAQVLLTSTGASNTFNVSFPGSLGGSIPAGLSLTFFSNQSVTTIGSSFINLNGLGSKSLYKNFNQNLAANDIMVGQAVSVIYDGANWQMLSNSANSGASQWINYTSGTISGIYYNNAVSIGSSPSGSYKFEVTGRIKSNGINETSDARFKKDIITLDHSLEKVMKLRGVSYAWRTSEFPQKEFSPRPQIGFIAQEIEKVYPELVETDKLGYKSVEYTKMVAILLEAIKEQQKLIESQSEEISGLKTSIEKFANLEKKFETLSELVNLLQQQCPVIHSSK
ncbi:MAG: tail fiber domain-containing protein [Cytophagales bacterium]|nr:tail fiber domain-containing protein [Cytophagales bacterium]